MAVRIHCGPSQLTEIWVDEQHLSRLDRHETREILLQILMFGGKKLREEVKGWLNGEEFGKVAKMIAPEPEEFPANGAMNSTTA